MKSYLIHDNGGRPFRVVVDGKHVEIFKKDKKDDEEDDSAYSKKIAEYDVEDIHIGKSSGTCKSCDHTKAQAKQFDGNSILLHVKGDSYVYIGHEIYSFNMKDKFEKYYSPVGNNDVPYPHILGKEFVYFMLDKKYVDRGMFGVKQVWEDAYVPWAGTFTPEKGWDSPIQDESKKMKTKQIHKRLW